RERQTTANGLPAHRGCGTNRGLRGRNSVVECQLPKLDVAGSTPVARSQRKYSSLRGVSFFDEAPVNVTACLLDWTSGPVETPPSQSPPRLSKGTVPVAWAGGAHRHVAATDA